MPSGKHSWLCSEHQKLPRVTVLPSIAEYQNDEDAGGDVPVASAAEYQLIQALKSIRDDYEVAVEEATCKMSHIINSINKTDHLTNILLQLSLNILKLMSTVQPS